MDADVGGWGAALHRPWFWIHQPALSLLPRLSRSPGLQPWIDPAVGHRRARGLSALPSLPRRAGRSTRRSDLHDVWRPFGLGPMPAGEHELLDPLGAAAARPPLRAPGSGARDRD